MALIGGRKDLIKHLLNIMFILSLLCTVTVGASAADLGAPSCHAGTAAWNKHGVGKHDRGPELKIACTCDCPCCTYVAHLIPLPPHTVAVQPSPPARDYRELAVDCVSLAIAPLTHPPNT